MKDLFKNKLFITFGAIICVLIIASVTIMVLKKNEKIAEKDEEKIEKVEVNEVDSMYQILSTVDCSKDLVWDFSTNDIISEKDIDESLKVKIVLSKLDSVSLLNESLTKTIFNEYSNKILNEVVALDGSVIEYNGKKYLIGEDKTTITDGSECTASKYVSMLFGFSHNENELSVDIAIAEVKDDGLYNIDGEFVGKNGTDNKDIIRNSTIYRYGFKLNNGDFYLDNITLVKIVKGPTE